MKPAAFRTYLWTWLALLALLALTFGSAYVHMGTFNLVVNLAIAVLKTLLVMIVFMDLARSTSLVRLAAAAGFFWLALLAGLSLTDFLTRS
ncbi:MAG TPA: cytochrome C oxidase subunit IV family protein [Steroidobacteraceae bacterium]|nr:cytochrome C oxidase subunit IV family protein [Steroidobacteraceae bacterium]